MASRRVNVTLDAEYADKLSRLADRAHVSEGTLARSLLSGVLDQIDPDPDSITALLDSIPGAFERAEQGRSEIEHGEGRDLDELRRWRAS